MTEQVMHSYESRGAIDSDGYVWAVFLGNTALSVTG